MVWRHKFFCLAFKDQERIPTTEGEKEELYRAGLGEKEITFEDVEMGREEFHESILDAFPRLKEGGGFRFLKGKWHLFQITLVYHTRTRTRMCVHAYACYRHPK